MGSVPHEPPTPWIETPLVYSAPVSKAAGCNIYLKLDNLQPSGSFKSRGIGNMMFRAIANSPAADVHFYCSSGGNAGLACVTSAIALRRKATVVVPTPTPTFMVQKLRDLGAEVIQTGNNWSEADHYLREQVMAKSDPATQSVYVPPFDHPDIWAGASSLIDEVAAQMETQHEDRPVDAIVCNVGGGGLLSGIMQGLERQKKRLAANGRVQPRVLAVETEGAHSLNASVAAGELVSLPKITSIATSLGAVRVAEETFRWTQRAGPEQLVCSVVTDGQAVMGVSSFLDDTRILVEVSCGATVVTAYNGDLRKYLGKGLTDEEWSRKNIVLVVCGGSSINLGLLTQYKETYGV